MINGRRRGVPSTSRTRGTRVVTTATTATSTAGRTNRRTTGAGPRTSTRATPRATHRTTARTTDDPQYDLASTTRAPAPTADAAHPPDQPRRARRLQAAARRKRSGRIIGVLAGAVLLGGMGAAAVAVYDKVSGAMSRLRGPGRSRGGRAGASRRHGERRSRTRWPRRTSSRARPRSIGGAAQRCDECGAAAATTRFPPGSPVRTRCRRSCRRTPASARCDLGGASAPRHSLTLQTGAVKKGIYTLIAEASCVGPADAQKCLTYDQLNEAGRGPGPRGAGRAGLGAGQRWRTSRTKTPNEVQDRHARPIAAGSWDFDPNADPSEILRQLVSSSAESYEATGLESAGGNVGLAPYQMLIVASLVEREALPLGLRQGRAGGGEPACGRPAVAVRLDGQLRTRHDGGRDHRTDRARVTP